MNTKEALDVIEGVRTDLQVARAKSVDFVDALEFIEENRSIVRDDVLDAFNVVIREARIMFAEKEAA